MSGEDAYQVWHCDDCDHELPDADASGVRTCLCGARYWAGTGRRLREDGDT